MRGVMFSEWRAREEAEANRALKARELSIRERDLDSTDRVRRSQAGLYGAQAGKLSVETAAFLPQTETEIANMQARTQYQQLVNAGYPQDLASQIALRGAQSYGLTAGADVALSQEARERGSPATRGAPSAVPRGSGMPSRTGASLTVPTVAAPSPAPLAFTPLEIPDNYGIGGGRRAITSYGGGDSKVISIEPGYGASSAPVAPVKPPALPSVPGLKKKDPLSFATGTSRVPGKGDGTKDTVTAKLAPGEAVLNKPAAGMMGRGFIDALNQLGLMQMGGMVE